MRFILIPLWVVIIFELKRKVKPLKGRKTAAQSEMFLSKSQEAVKVKYTYNFNSLDVVNTDSNLYCKYSEQEYFSKLNIDYFEYEQNSVTVSVKGRLKKSKKYWKDTLKANYTVLETIDSGYRIPLLYTPKKAYFRNNISALRNQELVEESILEVKKLGTVRETQFIPHVVNK